MHLKKENLLQTAPLPNDRAIPKGLFFKLVNFKVGDLIAIDKLAYPSGVWVEKIICVNASIKESMQRNGPEEHIRIVFQHLVHNKQVLHYIRQWKCRIVNHDPLPIACF